MAFMYLFLQTVENGYIMFRRRSLEYNAKEEEKYVIHYCNLFLFSQSGMVNLKDVFGF